MRDGLRAPIASVGVIGGGTAGYFAAIALKKRFPALRVALVESASIPIIGVGEATTTLMPPFLHHQLGIDIVDLYREVRPTWKLGIKFEWGLPGDYFFTYPFGETDTIDAYHHDGDIGAQSFTSLLMAADRSPLLRDADGAIHSLLRKVKFAYHLDNGPFVVFLARHAARIGVDHIDAVISDVITNPEQTAVESLRTSDGRELRFDLYVDATGFGSLLMGKALGSSFTSYASSLFCDTAVVADVPQRGVIAPYTLAETMECGWCWKIGVEGVDHRGYVFSSSFLSPEQAASEMRAKNAGMGDTRTVRFRSGRHREFWKGNTVAIGNAYGFVEPLESTGLHMVIIEIQHVIARLASDEDGPLDSAELNRRIGGHWDYLRWFLAVHYKFNRRVDSEFWRACRDGVDIGPLESAVAHVRQHGSWRSADGLDFLVGDPAFGHSGLLIMLLGQKIVAPLASSRIPAAAWAKRVAQQRSAVTRALPQAEALAILRTRPDLLTEIVSSPPSWCDGSAEVVSVSPATGRAHLPHES